MTIFSLEPLPAKHGDCLLLHFGEADAPGTILIDGGPARVWQKSLKPRLIELEQQRPGFGLSIDLLIVSHIDDDHIRGILDMTEEWRDAKTDGRRWPFPVRELWHNSFEKIAGRNVSDVRASLLASFGENGPFEAVADSDAKDALEIAKVLASVDQGSRLRSDAQLLNIPVNSGFDGLVRPNADDPKPVRLGPLDLHIVGPLPDQLKKLREKFASELPKSGEAALAAYTDASVANLSSIVVLARCENRSMLLTGDARGDFILEGLEQQGLLTDGKLHIDVLKLQHHGSDRNTEEQFFRKVTADCYVASADGLHENPDRETFEMLVAARDPNDRYTIRLTYEIDEIDVLREKERAKARAEAIRKHKRQIPDEWNGQKHSLAAFFDECKREGMAFTVETPATASSTKIDLLEEASF